MGIKYTVTYKLLIHAYIPQQLILIIISFYSKSHRLVNVICGSIKFKRTVEFINHSLIFSQGI